MFLAAEKINGEDIKKYTSIVDAVKECRKIDILEAIGHVGSKESLFFLSRILYNPSQKIRLVAASSLIRCLDQ